MSRRMRWHFRVARRVIRARWVLLVLRVIVALLALRGRWVLRVRLVCGTTVMGL